MTSKDQFGQRIQKLASLSDEEFHQVEDNVRGGELSAGTFLAEMALSRAKELRNLMRWQIGEVVEPVSQERYETIFHDRYPRHPIIDPESLSRITTAVSKHFDGLDEVCEAICCAVAARLPRRLDAYRFGQNGVEETLYVPSLGDVKVKIDHNYPFTFIRTIECESMQIYNCRRTGRQYDNESCECARPSEITVKPLDFSVSLYEDSSGIFVKTRGLRYTNSRCRVFGSGYASDCRRDDLYPDAESFNREMDASLQKEVQCLGGLSYEVRKDPQKYQEFIERLGRPFKIDWFEVQEQMSRWLQENMLAHILQMPENTDQATTKPEPTPFPAHVGPLYTWIKGSSARKIAATGGDLSRLRPEERVVAGVRYRLVPYGERGTFPPRAHDGFRWCGIGEVTDLENLNAYEIPGDTPEHDICSYERHLVRVNPKDGEDCFVVDYAAWDDYREEAFKTTHELSDVQMGECYASLARTLIPITDYRGDYAKPVVLFARGLELDEVELIPDARYKAD